MNHYIQVKLRILTEVSEIKKQTNRNKLLKQESVKVDNR